MAADELADMAAVLERYPERRAELVAIVGEDRMRQIEDARRVLEMAADRLRGMPDNNSAEA